ncbi:MAG: hypothetical protein MK003_02820 [Pseudomonadales bacterium]|nr:hypothetical protein [Pseudomonadales bacterium]MED5386519.1 hypothetical protein [Pseudomonadota bacterium]
MLAPRSLFIHSILTTTWLLIAALVAGTAFAQQPDLSTVKVTRLLDKPVIGPDIHPSIGVNIQGPSLIRVPNWVENPLGNYYLYFADHKGLYIRLAYADNLTGPWQVHEPGSLRIEDSYFTPTRPEISEEALAEMIEGRRASGSRTSHDLAFELTQPHIASPDVHVNEDSQQIIMYYHGLEGPGFQHSRVATSNDGINFTAGSENIGRTYMRAFKYEQRTYALAMPGQFYRSENGFTNFEEGPRLFVPNMRHSAVVVRDNYLYVFWTRVGDAPESIMLSTIDLRPDWTKWQVSEERVVLRPERNWEGADAPVEPSVRSTAYGHVNQLRDPTLYIEDDVVYMLYAVAGESGIALARVDF